MTPEQENNRGFIVPRVLLRETAVPITYVRRVEVPNASETILHLAEGESPFGPPKEYDEIDEEIREEVKKLEIHYSEVDVNPAMEHVRKRFSLKNSAHIIFDGEGSNGILKRSVELFRSRSYLSINLWGIGPHFPSIVDFVESFREITYAPIYTKSTASLAENIENARERLVRRRNEDIVFYLCNPNNPTGDAVPFNTIRNFANLCAENGNLLIIDEAFGDALPDNDSAMPLIETHPNIMVIRTLSKMLGLPGARIGYAGMSEPVAKKYKRSIEPYHMSARQQLLANRILDPDIVKRHLDGTAMEPGVRQKTQEVKNFLMEELIRQRILFFPTDPRTPIFMVFGDREGFLEELYERDLVGVGGSGFRRTYDERKMDDSWVRLTIPKNVADIPSIVMRIKSAIRAAQKERGFRLPYETL